MKSIKLYVTGVLAVAALALTCITGHAQTVTNFMAYNFDTDQVSGIWGNWFGGDFVGTGWDLNNDGSNNVNSGALQLTVNYNSSQYVCWDTATPTYSGLPLQGPIAFTNLSFDLRYFSATPPLVRTNADGSLTDFGNARIGTRAASYAQEWYYYYTIPATNSLGGPNTNWVRMSVDLTQVPVNFPPLATDGIVNTMFAQDDASFGNNVLHGTQVLWFDNIRYVGWIAPVPPPTMSIQKATPGLQLFGGVGIYGRSQLQNSTNNLNAGWVPVGGGGSYPVKYSWTTPDNATTPGGLDTHLTFLPGNIDTPEGNSGADYQQANCLWLQILSGGGTNTACVGNFSWKTNAAGCNPNAPITNALGQPQGGVVVWFTNSVRAGTWTVEFDSETTGKIIAPGSNNIAGTGPIPFDLTAPNPGPMPGGNSNAPALSAVGVETNFENPMYVRLGIMNYGNSAHSALADQWNSISVSGTVDWNPSVDFTKQGTYVIDTNLWDLTSSDGGASVTLQVPTNAPYWVKWNTPDSGYNNLEVSTNVSAGPWHFPEYYNAYTDGTNALPTQTLHSGIKWNLMMNTYLPTANGLTNPPGGNALSPNAFFRLTTNAPAL